MEFQHLPEFNKDLKYFLKKYKSLLEDLEVLKLILAKLPGSRPPFSFRVDQLGIEPQVIKIKKIACRSLKGRGAQTGLRLIYVYFPEHERIVFVEIYHKNDKDIEDRKRIERNFKKL